MAIAVDGRGAAVGWYKDRLPGEGPQHRVRITRPFCFGVYVVTQGVYQRVMSANGPGSRSYGPGFRVSLVLADK